MKVAREGIPWIVGMAFTGVVLAVLGLAMGARIWAVGLLGIGLAGAALMLGFFRDPERTPPADSQLVVSGADGRVMEVVEEHEPEFLKCSAVRISVFLSLFNVHVNRAPIGGRVVTVRYEPGRFRCGFDPRASFENERNSILIEGPPPCLVRQIVGILARRVVHWVTPGQVVERGQRIGLMKFGSRLDVYLPKETVEVLVRPGTIVRAGETAIARVRKE